MGLIVRNLTSSVFRKNKTSFDHIIQTNRRNKRKIETTGYVVLILVYIVPISA